MPKKCKVCLHPKRLKIDRALVQGHGISALAREYKLRRHVLSWHFKNHVARQLVKANEMKEVAHGHDLASELVSLVDRAKSLLDEAESQGKLTVALKGISETRATIESLARIAVLLRQEEQRKDMSEKRTEIEKLKKLDYNDLESLEALLSKAEGKVVHVSSLPSCAQSSSSAAVEPLPDSVRQELAEIDAEITKPKKRKRVPIPRDLGNDNDNTDEDEQEDELNGLRELNFHSDRDSEGFTREDRLKRRPKHEIAGSYLLDVKKEHDRFNRRKKIADHDPSGFVDAVRSGKARVMTLR